RVQRNAVGRNLLPRLGYLQPICTYRRMAAPSKISYRKRLGGVGFGDAVGLVPGRPVDLLCWHHRHLYFENIHRDKESPVHHRSQGPWGFCGQSGIGRGRFLRELEVSTRSARRHTYTIRRRTGGDRFVIVRPCCVCDANEWLPIPDPVANRSITTAGTVRDES